METYIAKLESSKSGWKQRFVSALLFGAVYFAFSLCRKILWPGHDERSAGLLGIIIETGFVSFIWGIGMSLFQPRISLNYRLEVDDNSITGVVERKGLPQWLVTRRTIRKGKVLATFEVKGRLGLLRGMGFSERSKWSARLMGFVFIPKNLPEYEDLKTLAESWRVPESI